jgi:phospholipase/lecithinase/hemolysin
MRKRVAFRPSAGDALEERIAPSRGGAVGAEVPANPLDHVRAARVPRIAVGALGDSYTDEYRFYPPDRSQARDWVEILAATRGVNFGAFTTASRGEPRDQGFAFNWARSDATSADMVARQLPGLAAQVRRGQAGYAWIFVGANDYKFFLLAAATAPPAAIPQLAGQLGQIEARLEANFTTAVNTLLAANPKVRLVVATLPDLGLLPLARALEAVDPALGPLVAAVGQQTSRYNALIRTTAAGNGRVALADLAAEAEALQATPGGPVPFGGTAIDLATTGDDFRHFYLADGVHVGTVGQGLIADAFVAALDARFGVGLAPLSPEQIVQFAARVTRRTP